MKEAWQASVAQKIASLCVLLGMLFLVPGIVQAKAKDPFRGIEKGIKKGAEETGKGIKKGAETVGKGVQKGTEVVVGGVTDVGKAVAQTTKTVVLTVGGKTIGGTLVSFGGAVGDVFVSAGKGAGQLVVKVGAGAVAVVLNPGDAFQHGGKLIINVGDQILALPQEAVGTIKECGEAAFFGGQLMTAEVVQKAADLVAGAIDKVFNLTDLSIKGNSSDLIKQGLLPEATVKGKLLGKEISFDLKIKLDDPVETVEGIFHQFVGLLPV